MIASKLTSLKKSTLVLGAAIVAMTGALAVPAQAKSKVQIYVGVPLGIGVVGYGYGYGPSCHWLKEKAIDTGSAYWWKKYKQCKYG